MADRDGIPERERRQMEEILQLDLEELNVEVVDDDDEEEEEQDAHDDDDDADLRDNGDGVASTSGPCPFNTSLASMHTYLGEVDDTRGRVSLLDGGAVLNIPIFYLRGIVLFPGATLPLRIIQTRFRVAIDKALRLVDAPCTIGVILVYRDPSDRYYATGSVGTTAEIRQHGRLEDGSLNVVTRGQQRFRLRRHWNDDDQVVWGEVQIIEEDTPLRTPRDAFAQLAACNSFRLRSSSSDISLNMPPIKQGHMDSELECDTPSPCSDASNHSSKDTKLCPLGPPLSDSVLSSNEDKMSLNDACLTSPEFLSTARDTKWQRQCHAVSYSKHAFQAPLSFWPRWTYEIYDSYTLARRAADLWKQIIANPSMEDHVRKPDILSFHIGSKLPVSEYLRQKLLELDGTSYRLQKEIQILKAFNLIKCRDCQSLIAKRSDMVVMSTDGPLGAYVNPYGCVHETITVSNATGLALTGSPSTVHSWFPGYSWTIAHCAACESHIGWLFRATKKNLRPRSFWGIRSSQIADDTQLDQNE
ncbi:hypothetical protein EJB05_36755 [Eragrostis curvula]|uniref:Protein cereblon n=1 Tax=Eragrostis curvula TaxID=38414 RepID=A0A5J9U9Y0_9POAL|nr:hypothetical protein EJB05_36755 [Eragrostis curvula]